MPAAVWVCTVAVALVGASDSVAAPGACGFEESGGNGNKDEEEGVRDMAVAVAVVDAVVLVAVAIDAA
jgi:hypothetical protein